MQKITFSDFVAAGVILFHLHISFNLKSAPIVKLEDFFQIAKIVRHSRQNSIALLDDNDVTVLKRFKIVTVAWFIHFLVFSSPNPKA